MYHFYHTAEKYTSFDRGHTFSSHYCKTNTYQMRFAKIICRYFVDFKADSENAEIEYYGSLANHIDTALQRELLLERRKAKVFQSSDWTSRPDFQVHLNGERSADPSNNTTTIWFGLTSTQYALTLNLREWASSELCKGSFKAFKYGHCTNGHQISSTWAAMKGFVHPQRFLLKKTDSSKYLECTVNIPEKQLTIGDILLSCDYHQNFVNANTLNGILSVGLYVFLLHHKETRYLQTTYHNYACNSACHKATYYCCRLQHYFSCLVRIWVITSTNDQITVETKQCMQFRLKWLVNLTKDNGAVNSETTFLDRTVQALNNKLPTNILTALFNLQLFLLHCLHQHNVVKHFQESELFTAHIRPHICLSEYGVQESMETFYKMHQSDDKRPIALSKSRKIWLSKSNTLVADFIAALIRMTNIAAVQKPLQNTECSIPGHISQHKAPRRSISCDTDTTVETNPTGQLDILYAFLDMGLKQQLTILYCMPHNKNWDSDELQTLVKNHFFGDANSQDFLESFVLGLLHKNQSLSSSKNKKKWSARLVDLHARFNLGSTSVDIYGAAKQYVINNYPENSTTNCISKVATTAPNTYSASISGFGFAHFQKGTNSTDKCKSGSSIMSSLRTLLVQKLTHLTKTQIQGGTTSKYNNRFCTTENTTELNALAQLVENGLCATSQQIPSSFSLLHMIKPQQQSPLKAADITLPRISSPDAVLIFLAMLLEFQLIIVSSQFSNILALAEFFKEIIESCGLIYCPVYAPIISRRAASQIIESPFPFCIGWYAPEPKYRTLLNAPHGALVIDIGVPHPAMCCIQIPKELQDIVSGEFRERSIHYKISQAIEDSIISTFKPQSDNLLIKSVLQSFLQQVLRGVAVCSFSVYARHPTACKELEESIMLFDELHYCRITEASLNELFSIDTTAFLTAICRTQTLSTYITSTEGHDQAIHR